MTERTFDRLPQPDPRNAAFPIRALVSAEQARAPRSYSWRVAAQLDQGREGACVGFAWAHELAARPVIMPVDAQLARQLYFAAQARDEWSGGAYPGAQPFYEGTSVIAGAKVLHDAGHFAEYRWAESVADLILAVGYHGPAVLGIDWHAGMLDTDPDGFIRPSGPVLGGHAILAYSVSVKGGFFRLHNSWGPDWGQHGVAKLSFSDAAVLLAGSSAPGEACIPIARRRIAPTAVVG